MKKVVLTLLCAAFATAVMAEETPKKPSFKGFVSNGFWDNWELSVGAGAGTALTSGKNLGPFGERIGFEGNISATKWLHPVIGLRLQLQGGQFNNFDPSQGKENWPYLFVHTDFMVDVSNWIGGYREDRAYYFVPFFGWGYMTANFTDKSQRDNVGSQTGQTFAFSYGILNKFRLSKSFDFNIELKGLLAHSRMMPVKTNGSSFLNGFSATAGFSYRFNKRGWERGVVGYTADDIRAFQAAVAKGNEALAAAEAENARLNDRLKAAQAAADAARAAAEAAKNVVVEQSQPCVEKAAMILYDFDKATLSPKEKTRLNLLAQTIKDGPKDRVYRINGHADNKSGTSEVNMRLSKRRAKAVYDYLVGKGVNPKQLVYEGKGDTENLYPVRRANRSVVVE